MKLLGLHVCYFVNKISGGMGVTWIGHTIYEVVHLEHLAILNPGKKKS